MVSTIFNTALLFIAGINTLNGFDCDHYGPYPTGRCIGGFVVNCINGSDGDWDLAFTLYEDEDCSGNVTLETTFDCFDQFGGCGCGYGECEDDQLMLIELGQEPVDVNDTDSDSVSNSTETECVNATEYPLIKDSCISAGDWLGPQDGIVSVELLCDEDTQQILYYAWTNDDCFGRPTNEEPLIYLDLHLANVPCVELMCGDFNVTDLNVTDFNTTDILDFNGTDIFDLNTTDYFDFNITDFNETVIDETASTESTAGTESTETTQSTGLFSTISTFFGGNNKPRNT